MPEFIQSLMDVCVDAGSKLILALIVWFAGKWLIGRVMSIFSKLKAVETMDATVSAFVISVMRGALYVLLAVSIIGIMGVPMASVIAVIASSGVAVGLALQGALSNLAGGIMLMVFRPFSVGDYIGAAGAEGSVREITMFYTKLCTADNIDITIPNGSLMNANIINYTGEPMRRMDIRFSVAKDTDIEQVKAVIVGALKATDGILKDQEISACCVGGTNEAMEINARGYIVPAMFAGVSAQATENITKALGAAGIKAPAMRVIADK
ncbi:MAG: mechanosensitive ion channel [Clostridia bacterium]|nr:mechanosensitive ion channel [Clostridia bacterium]